MISGTFVTCFQHYTCKWTAFSSLVISLSKNGKSTLPGLQTFKRCFPHPNIMGSVPNGYSQPML